MFFFHPARFSLKQMGWKKGLTPRINRTGSSLPRVFLWLLTRLSAAKTGHVFVPPLWLCSIKTGIYYELKLEKWIIFHFLEVFVDARCWFGDCSGPSVKDSTCTLCVKRSYTTISRLFFLPFSFFYCFVFCFLPCSVGSRCWWWKWSVVCNLPVFSFSREKESKTKWQKSNRLHIFTGSKKRGFCSQWVFHRGLFPVDGSGFKSGLQRPTVRFRNDALLLHNGF